MSRSTVTILLLGALWGTPSVFSEPPEVGTVVLPNPAEADVARKKAKSYAEEKNWKAARDEAIKATRLDPNLADAWLILGAAEQRLERNSEARDAYRKYLSFNPPADKAAVVRTRLAQVELITDKHDKAERERKEAKYGRNAKGPILGFAPLYHPKVSGTEGLGHNASTALLLGYRLGEQVSLFFRWHQGTIANFASTTTTGTNVDAKLVALEGQYGFILNEPFDKWFGFQFYIPLNLQLFTNWVNGNPSVYMNFGFSLGTGVGVRYYTRAPVIFDAVFLYHFAAPFSDVESQGTADKALNVSGATEKGNASGPEFRLCATLIF